MKGADESRQPGQPDCAKCSGAGVVNVPFIGMCQDGTVGATERTHEAKCLCTFPALWKHRDIVRDVFRKIAEEDKQ